MSRYLSTSAFRDSTQTWRGTKRRSEQVTEGERVRGFETVVDELGVAFFEDGWWAPSISSKSADLSFFRPKNELAYRIPFERVTDKLT